MAKKKRRNKRKSSRKAPKKVLRKISKRKTSKKKSNKKKSSKKVLNKITRHSQRTTKKSNKKSGKKKSNKKGNRKLNKINKTSKTSSGKKSNKKGKRKFDAEETEIFDEQVDNIEDVKDQGKLSGKAEYISSNRLKKGIKRATTRLKGAGILDKKGDLKKYTPKNLKVDYKGKVDFQEKAKGYFGNNRFNKKGKFKGGRAVNYKDSQGNFKKAHTQMSYVTNNGKIRKYGENPQDIVKDRVSKSINKVTNTRKIGNLTKKLSQKFETPKPVTGKYNPSKRIESISTKRTPTADKLISKIKKRKK